MAVGKCLQIRAIAPLGEQIYNYLGTLAIAHLYYNEDNRFLISPIRETGGGEKRAILIRTGLFSSPPSRMQLAANACIRLDETALVEVFALEWSIVTLPGRGKRQVATPNNSCRSLRSRARHPFRPDGATHFDED